MEGNSEVTQEEVEAILRKALDSFIKESQSYVKEKATQSTQTIIDYALKDLVKMKKNYKFTVTCILMQKNGAGLTSAAANYGEQSKDGYISAMSDYGPFQAILTAFFVAI